MKLCIIGTGKMGGSLASGLAKGGAISPKDIVLVDYSFRKAREAALRIGATARRTAAEGVREAKVVIIAVKHVVDEVLRQLGKGLSGKLLVSVAATIPFSFIESRTPRSCRVALVIPNIAMQSGARACALVLGRGPPFRRQAPARAPLLCAGFAMRLERESDLDQRVRKLERDSLLLWRSTRWPAHGAPERDGEEAGVTLAAAAAYGRARWRSRAGRSLELLRRWWPPRRDPPRTGSRSLREKGVSQASFHAEGSA